MDQEVAPQETSTILAEPQAMTDDTTVEIPIDGIETAEPFNPDDLLTITGIAVPTAEQIPVAPTPVLARARRTTRTTVPATSLASEVEEQDSAITVPF